MSNSDFGGNFNKKLLMQQMGSCDVISFDIFDTLLLRPFVNPTDLFWYMEKELEIPEFASLRIDTEHRLREQLIDTEEVLLKDIYANMTKYSDMADAELDYELNLLYPNGEMQEIFNAAVSMKKTIIIISDIYLPETFIDKVLRKNGYSKFNKLFVSSTWGKEKWTGNLFRVVLDDLKVPPQKILHIGDNFNADYDMAKSLNINSFFYPKVIDRFFDNDLHRNVFQNIRVDAHIPSTLTMKMADRFRNNFSNYWHKFGYELAGPACFAYAKFVADVTSTDTDVTGIAFVARDGYLIKKIYDKLFSKTNISTHYVYASRSLNLLYRLDFKESYYDNATQIKTILKQYSFCLANKNINIDKLSDSNAKSLLEANYETIKACAVKNHEVYKKYLKQKDFGKGKVLVVDTITDKFSAQKIIASSIKNNVLGVYWIVLSGALNNSDGNEFKSFQKEHYNKLRSWDLMEFIISSPEPPIKEVSDNGIPLYYSENQFEKTRIEIFRDIEKGVDDFINDIIETPLLKTGVDNDTITEWINSYLDNPKPIDYESFKFIYFSLKPDHSDLNQLNPFNNKKENTQQIQQNSFKQRIKALIKQMFRPIYRKLVVRAVVELDRSIFSHIRHEIYAIKEAQNVLEEKQNKISDLINERSQRFEISIDDLKTHFCSLANAQKAHDEGSVNRNYAIEHTIEKVGRQTHRHIDFTYRDIMIVLRNHLRTGAWGQEVKLISEHPIADTSNDYIAPHGTIRDNTRFPRFIRKCETIFHDKEKLNFLDLGCSGGGIVLDALLRGHYALGLEGCDISLIQQRAEWRLIPEHLKTCDISKPFGIVDSKLGNPVEFDVISAWEVLEHIPEKSLPALLSNINSHLTENGIFVASVASWDDIDPITGVNWHVTVKDYGWWEELFGIHGFRLHPELLDSGDLARGSYNPPNCYEDPGDTMNIDPELNFYIVAKKQNDLRKEL